MKACTQCSIFAATTAPALAGPAPLPVRPLCVRRPAPTVGARLPIFAVPLAAALGTASRGDVAPSSLPDVFPVRVQCGAVARMRGPVPILRVRQAPPAASAREPVRSITAAPALDAQAGGAVAVPCSWSSGRQEAPAGIAYQRVVG